MPTSGRAPLANVKGTPSDRTHLGYKLLSNISMDSFLLCHNLPTSALQVHLSVVSRSFATLVPDNLLMNPASW